MITLTLTNWRVETSFTQKGLTQKRPNFLCCNTITEGSKKTFTSVSTALNVLFRGQDGKRDMIYADR